MRRWQQRWHRQWRADQQLLHNIIITFLFIRRFLGARDMCITSRIFPLARQWLFLQRFPPVRASERTMVCRDAVWDKKNSRSRFCHSFDQFQFALCNLYDFLNQARTNLALDVADPVKFFVRNDGEGD